MNVHINLFFCNRSISRGGQVWAPEGSTAFKCLLSARFCAALLSNISDCDETFNYWEPVSTDLCCGAFESAVVCCVTVFLMPASEFCSIPLLFQWIMFVFYYCVLTDALLALRHRNANMGILSTVCHQVLCLLMVTCTSCLLACPCSTDKQGKYRKVGFCHVLMFLYFIIGMHRF